jgi:hypothetical protein
MGHGASVDKVRCVAHDIMGLKNKKISVLENPKSNDEISNVCNHS